MLIWLYYKYRHFHIWKGGRTSIKHFSQHAKYTLSLLSQIFTLKSIQKSHISLILYLCSYIPITDYHAGGASRGTSPCGVVLQVPGLSQTTRSNDNGHINDKRTYHLSRPGLSVIFAKRQANKAAHLMAWIPCLLDCQSVYTSPPSMLLETLMYDVSF